MRKAWSFFWLVVASCIALVIISQLLAPYIGVIAIAFVVVLVVVVAVKVYRNKNGQRRHF